MGPHLGDGLWEWEPWGLEKETRPVPFALGCARMVLGTGPLRAALAEELGQAREQGLCFHLPWVREYVLRK